MADFQVATVCGAGVGTSTLLRINVEDVFKTFDLPFRVRVINTSISRAKGTKCDLIVTSETFAAEARTFCPSVITIKNFMDKEELKTKIGDFLSKQKLV
jgi:PTS system ascorbate-specific IIB component